MAVSSVHMRATWPPAHYAWVVTSDGFENTDIRTRFLKESSRGDFCHDQNIPSGVKRIAFPIVGGTLAFNTTDTDSQYWSVNIVFNDLREVVPGRSVLAKAQDGWTWRSSTRGNGMYCSSQLGPVDEVFLNSNSSTGTTKYNVPGALRKGTNATLGIEMIRRGRNLMLDDSITTVLRQCTFIQFQPLEDLEYTGPCGAKQTPTPSPLPSSGAGDMANRYHDNFELWGTFIIVLGVAAIAGLVAFFFQRRGRKRAKESDGAEVPVYDAAAARMRQQESFVPAPDYTAANGGVPLPTYDEATK